MSRDAPGLIDVNRHQRWQRATIRAGLLILMLLPAVGAAHAQTAEPVLHFDNPSQESLYEKLVTEYRCLKCQNQNLADSRAELAGDLKRQVYQQVVAGKDQAQIDDYLVSRYGDFVLYRPRFQASTWLLWLGPFVLLGLALFLGYRISTGARQPAAEKPTADAMAEARRLLEDSRNI